MAELTIRLATLADLPEILRLEALFPSDRMDRRALRRFLRAPAARFWVAVSGSRIIGNLLMLLRHRSHGARIYSLIVDPASRGLGLGAKLVEVAEQEARQQGRRIITLEVRNDNGAARALYAARGYSIAQQLPQFYDDGADGLRLVKTVV